jgi:hypothetical protein
MVPPSPTTKTSVAPFPHTPYKLFAVPLFIDSQLFPSSQGISWKQASDGYGCTQQKLLHLLLLHWFSCGYNDEQMKGPQFWPKGPTCLAFHRVYVTKTINQQAAIMTKT